MAIKLLGHVWKTAAAATSSDRAHGNDWVVEVREPSRWNPAAVRVALTPEAAERSAAEPAWAETQPWCHD